MNPFRHLSFAILTFASLAILGCGPGDNTVIEHTEDYQLTDQEEANKQAEIEARKNGGD